VVCYWARPDTPIWSITNLGQSLPAKAACPRSVPLHFTEMGGEIMPQRASAGDSHPSALGQSRSSASRCRYAQCALIPKSRTAWAVAARPIRPASFVPKPSRSPRSPHRVTGCPADRNGARPVCPRHKQPSRVECSPRNVVALECSSQMLDK